MVRRSLRPDALVTRDFSNRKVRTSAPSTLWSRSNLITRYLPKRDELLLRTVFALPSDSRTGFVRKMSSLRCSRPAAVPARQIRKCIRCLFVSVLPAPDSPATRSDCDCLLSRMCTNDISATAKMCGSRFVRGASLYLAIISSPYRSLGPSAGVTVLNGLRTRRISEM